MAGSGLITILFTDLVGSTALAQQLGDTAADALRRDHFDQLRRATDGHRRHRSQDDRRRDDDKAVAYCRRAGDAAIADLAFEEAAAHFEHALESLALQSPIDEQVRADLLFAAGNALHQISDPRGRDLLKAAEASASSLDDMQLLARVLIGLSADVLVRAAAEVDEHTVGLYQLVLSRGDELPAAVLARTMAAYSRELFFGGHLDRRRQLCEDALDIARRLGDDRVLAEVLASVNIMIDLTAPEGFDQLLAYTTEMIEVAAGVDDSLVCNALIGRTIVSACRGHVTTTASDLVQAESLAERLRIPQLIARTKLHRGALALLAGQLDNCEVLLADYEAYSRELVGGGTTAAVGSVRYRLQYERGDLGGLETFLVQLIEAQPLIPVWRMALCGVYLQSDRHELCRPHVEAIGADDFAMVPRNQVFLLTCSSTARVAGEVGVLDVAEVAYRHASPFDDVFPFSGAVFEYPVGIGVGAAAAALGWHDLAEQHYANAHALCERAGAPTYLAATQVHWAEMLTKRNGPNDLARAHAMAASARASAERLGLAYILKRAERVLAG